MSHSERFSKQQNVGYYQECLQNALYQHAQLVLTPGHLVDHGLENEES